MSAALLRCEDVINLLRAAARRIDRESARLSELDAACGDGDHGVSMARGFAAVDAALRGARFESPAAVFQAAGEALVGSAGGAIGPLLGTLFIEASRALEGAGPAGEASARGVDTRALAAAFRAGAAGVCRRGGARAGDKTLVDALLPAVVALEEAAAHGLDPAAALRDAATAARAGASHTATMVARQGRARYLGERALGHEDAGANSIAVIFEAFSDARGAPGSDRQ